MKYLIGLLAFAVLTGFTALQESTAHACSLQFFETPEESFQNATAVIHGTVLSEATTEQDTYTQQRVTFSVQEQWKGVGTTEIELVIREQKEQAECSSDPMFTFEKDQQYLVYAENDPRGFLTTSTAFRTKKSDNESVEEDLLYLRENISFSEGCYWNSASEHGETRCADEKVHPTCKAADVQKAEGESTDPLPWWKRIIRYILG